MSLAVNISLITARTRRTVHGVREGITREAREKTRKEEGKGMFGKIESLAVLEGRCLQRGGAASNSPPSSKQLECERQFDEKSWTVFIFTSIAEIIGITKQTTALR
jgi:hypothetical protein